MERNRQHVEPPARRATGPPVRTPVPQDRPHQRPRCRPVAHTVDRAGGGASPPARGGPSRAAGPVATAGPEA